MKILIVTPLYPPDIAASGLYVKELAARLSAEHSSTSQNEVAIVTYGTHPEKIPGVEILATSKHRPLLFRIFLFTLLLMRASQKADVMLVENGASVELPIFFFSFFKQTPYIFHLSDKAAHAYAAHNSLYGFVERIASKRARETLTDIPLPKPEILPYVPYPDKEFSAHEASWATHLKKLHELFKTYYV